MSAIRLHRWAAPLALALLLASEPRAVARADDDARAQAAAHFKRGVEQANQRNFADALAEFEAAYKLVQHAAALYNIALSQAALDRPAAAADTLRRYLADAPPSEGASKLKAAQQLLDELTQKLASAAPAQLTVIVFPYGPVWIDGKASGSSPLVIGVQPGKHTISGGRDGQDQTADVIVESGESRRVVLAWARKELLPAGTP
ncbi:MAG TPA: hypothetical protein VHM19_15130 [Polyangiales bacterium]|jgi:tetratricopeptide (TPR) repeat protein|nr:hypothetical protein [Polyangiales bacterium]